MKPETIGRKLDPEKQQAFIEAYEKAQNSPGPDEVVLFMDAVHPTHAARATGCWAPAGDGAVGDVVGIGWRSLRVSRPN